MATPAVPLRRGFEGHSSRPTSKDGRAIRSPVGRRMVALRGIGPRLPG